MRTWQGEAPRAEPEAAGAEPVPVLDAHHHVWDLSVRDQPWLGSDPELAPLRRNFAIADLEPLAAAAGVTATVVVQTVTQPGETGEMLALAVTEPLLAAVIGWVDLTAPDVADALAVLRDLPGGGFLAGLRHPVLFDPEPDWLTRPEVLRGLAAVAAAGLTFDLVVEPFQLPAAAEAAAARPDLTFVLDHLGNADVVPQVDAQWASAIRRLAALPNTVCKLSGILSAPAPEAGPASAVPAAGDAAQPGAAQPGAAQPGAAQPGAAQAAPSVAHMRPYYLLALDGFGPDRMMFGSDWPVSTLGAAYGEVVGAARALTADLSRAEQEAIFGQTARRVYRISDQK